MSANLYETDELIDRATYECGVYSNATPAELEAVSNVVFAMAEERIFESQFERDAFGLWQDERLEMSWDREAKKIRYHLDPVASVLIQIGFVAMDAPEIEDEA